MKKFLLHPRSYPMLEFEPPTEEIDTTYDGVAPLYDETFEDISVRADELRWLRRRLSELHKPRLLDLGCGTGSFLRAIEDLVEQARGVDLSAGMISHALKRSTSGGKLSFTKIDGPQLPFADDSFDVVTSILSFRYLDWDPIIAEVLRVADGCVVGSALKYDGHTWNAIDPDRARDFMALARTARGGK